MDRRSRTPTRLSGLPCLSGTVVVPVKYGSHRLICRRYSGGVGTIFKELTKDFVLWQCRCQFIDELGNFYPCGGRVSGVGVSNVILVDATGVEDEMM